LPSIKVFRRLGAKRVYVSPHILIKEGLSNWELCASYLDKNCSFNSKVLGIHHTDSKLLKGLVCFINSQFALYYIFLTSASIGIEREEIKPNELYDLPLFLKQKQIYFLSDLYDKYIVPDALERRNNIELLEKKINEYIFRKLHTLKRVNSSIIQDFIQYTIPLLRKNTAAIRMHPKQGNIKRYAESICLELNEFLEGQDFFANPTSYLISKYNPLNMIKISFDNYKKELIVSDDNVNIELKKIDKYLWEKQSTNIYFRKKMNYKNGDDIYIIRPNQERFWSHTMALEDASELILEILNRE